MILNDLFIRCSYPPFLDDKKFYKVALIDYEFKTISVFLNNKTTLNLPFSQIIEIKNNVFGVSPQLANERSE